MPTETEIQTTGTESGKARKRRVRKFIEGIGWVTPRRGYCWTARGDKVRSLVLPAWGSRRGWTESLGEQSADWF